MPGLVFLLALIIPVILVNTDKLIEFIGKDNTINAIIVLTVISGVIGFLISTIYWAIFQSFDWLNLIMTVQQSRLNIVDRDNNSISITSNEDAWNVFNSFWYLNQDNELLDVKADRLARLTHSTGTAFLSLFLSILIWITLFIWKEIPFCFCFCGSILWVVLFWLIFLFALGFNYLKTLRRYKLFLNTVFTQLVIQKNAKDNTTKIVLNKQK